MATLAVLYARTSTDPADARLGLRRIGALANGVTNRSATTVDSQQARAIARGLTEAGIRPSNKHRRVGDYQLGEMIAEGENYQDWAGQHVSIETVHRRVRVYPFADAATVEARKTLVRQAAREFQILEGIDHPGILKVRDYKESEQGPALIFDHDAKSQRLDFLLREQGSRLSADQRLHRLRNLAETLKYFYLAFADQDMYTLDTVVFSTEAHPYIKAALDPEKIRMHLGIR